MKKKWFSPDVSVDFNIRLTDIYFKYRISEEKKIVLLARRQKL